MKHIFKKLHIGSSSSSNSSTTDPNRSNEIISPPPSSSPSDHVTTPTPVADRIDYISSEEEFQLQLALAISASSNSNSNSEFKGNNNDIDKDQIRAATLLSLTPINNRINSRRDVGIDSAESLSRRYWDYNVLDYMEKVVDGFYDIYGLPTDCQGKMPSLADIQTNHGDPSFEVVTVNRAIDPALVELEQVAHCIALDCPSTNVELLVQRLADIVTEHMGGPVRDANIILAKWMDRIMDLRTSLHTCVLPLGSLNIGLSRHRALLFKVLADNVGVPCRLVKGSHYTGIDDDAVNIIKLENEREFLVDLMAAPGTLIPAEFLSTNDASVSSYNPRLSGTYTSWATQESGRDYSRAERLQGVNEDSNGKSIVEDGIVLDRNSPFKKAELLSLSSASNGLLPVSSGNSSNEGSKDDHSAKPLCLFSPFSYTGNQDAPSLTDTFKERSNVPPYAQDVVDSKALFADLNPFQMIGAGKSSAKNNPTDSNALDFQRQKERIASGPGRPPLPLVWKNRSTCNEVPRTKQYGYVEGQFPKKNQEDRDYNTSVASSSSATSEKLYPILNVAEPSDRSRASREGTSGVSFADYGNSLSRLSTEQYNRWHSDGDGKVDVAQTSIQRPDKNNQQRVGEIFQNNFVDKTKESGNNAIGNHDRREFSHDRFTDSRLIVMDPKDKNSSLDAGRSRPEPMLDDVAELEIPWEHLYIGERIGLAGGDCGVVTYGEMHFFNIIVLDYSSAFGGIGSYGEVYRADWNGMEVAVKKFLDQDFYGDALDEFKSEVRIMRRLRHPNVVLFVGAVTRPPNLSIVTEFLPRGSLYRILHRPNCQIDEKRRIRMALDVAMGMNCLHTSMPTIVHRDLKSLNLLVDDNWNVKVCDFGLSRLKHNTFLSSKSTAGTPEWMAPEVLRNEPSNEKCDVYSFGIILWELATLRLPWTGMNQMQVVGAVGFQNRRLDIPKELDPLVATIIRECWQTDPNLRPSFSQLTVALQSLQRLVIPSHQDQQSLPLSQEISL
ncbi:hypothetical protein IFM89_032514 [Coptis chinensis]|uniref:non-specific serine/threonine protein kinase n=1 Tax=Coptis chinensis TaxID=261450 RepID=A0A835M7Y3_9MAGN|nr:hypothetical protein IFM89_032514 [Coptis chinensis]